MTFDSGVSGYKIGTAVVCNPFPKNSRGIPDICCDQCRFQYGRRCALTGEINAYPSKYRGDFCPLDFEEENIENENEKESNTNVPDSI